jgi:hypothetical protein
MLLRALPALLLALSATACGTVRSEVAPRAQVAISADGAPARARSCAVGGARFDDGSFRYAYAALSTEMRRLRDPAGAATFDVRRTLDRVADVVDEIEAHDAALRIRAEVSNMIDRSPSQGAKAQAARRALEETHEVLRRLSIGPCRGDAALGRRVEQLREAVELLPDDPNLRHVSLVPVVTALQRAQGAFLALSTSDKRRPAQPAARMTVAMSDERTLE